MKITNNSQQPQGVHSANGLVFIQPGKSREVELPEWSYKAAKELSFLTIDGEPKAAPAPPKAEPKPPKEPKAPSELTALRNEYKAAFGKGPSPKWDAATIRAKIAETAKLDDLKAQAKELGLEVTDDAEKLKAAIDAKLAS